MIWRTFIYSLIFLTYFLCSIFVVFSFSVEELKNINYAVDISSIPVKKELHKLDRHAVRLTSRSGQEFQCVLPQVTEEKVTEKEFLNEKDVDIVGLLKPLKARSCLYKVIDWWTYEFCFGHYIKQFHIEGSQILEPIITLGLYESDYDWSNQTDQEKFQHAKERYHSQYYTNGSMCELIGKPRSAEIRIFCEEDAVDYIYRVDEPGTCNYVISIHTSRVCSHPKLKPLSPNKARSIACHPILNEEEYSNYLQKLKVQKVTNDEKQSQCRRDMLQELKNEDLSPVDRLNLEIKVIKDYYGNENEKDTQPLKEGEVNEFQIMVISVLNGQREAVQEIRRQTELEENYKFTWDESEKNNEK